MGSKISTQHKRLTKIEYTKLLSSIDKNTFLNDYLHNGNEAICQKYNIGLGPMYRLLNDLNIKLTKEQLINRNVIATQQKLQLMYGVDNNFQRSDVQKLITANNLIKYGVENQFQRQEIKDKIKQTCIKKYGVEYVAQSPEVHSKAQTKYIYEQEYFDSFPELAVWLYAKDHNILIKREPKKFSYIVDNVEHHYFPDFEIDGQLVEIKGLQFFKNKDPNETMINPYDSSKNKLAEAKHQCIIQNNVAIWTEQDYIKYVEYALANYEINAFIRRKNTIE